MRIQMKTKSVLSCVLCVFVQYRWTSGHFAAVFCYGFQIVPMTGKKKKSEVGDGNMQNNPNCTFLIMNNHYFLNSETGFIYSGKWRYSCPFLKKNKKKTELFACILVMSFLLSNGYIMRSSGFYWAEKYKQSRRRCNIRDVEVQWGRLLRRDIAGMQ